MSTWQDAFDDRTLQYAGKVLDPTVCIEISIAAGRETHYETQVSAITLTALISRMTCNMVLKLPEVPIADGLPWLGQTLSDLCQERARGVYPENSPAPPEPSSHYRICIGGSDGDCVVDGSGWNAYLGTAPSPIQERRTRNPVGAAFAAILCAAKLFNDGIHPPNEDVLIDAWNWKQGSLAPATADGYVAELDLGNLWFVGLGSVGSAAAFFLAMATRRFSPSLIDHDSVEVENLSRSPAFESRHVGDFKVTAVADFLREAGVSNVVTEHVPLLEAHALHGPTPDIIVSAANEMNVRETIEGIYPPLQIYGTTGTCYQASLIRHIPEKEACSCCLFDDSTHAKTKCASAPAEAPGPIRKQIDAALPFLSFAAGLMAASEILKSKFSGYPFHLNRVTLNTLESIRIQQSEIPVKEGCICGMRNPETYHKILGR